MKQIPKRALDEINIPKKLAQHAFGCHHSHGHRISFGAVIMVIGVLIAQLFEHNILLHILADCTGYLFHGAGAVPIIDFAVLWAQRKTN